MANNKLIAKNTLLLYFRMILLMAVTLYTSRVILATLGIENYGLYNLIGGFIAIFSFISAALVTSIQRFFNVSLGRNETERLKQIYTTSINIFLLFSLFLVIIGETLGFWFVKNMLNIPAGRESAAMWTYQISIITLIVHLLRTPDNAAIIAYEKMGFYAYLSIGEALLKLGIVFALKVIGGDKLIIYVLLYLATTILINIAYNIYCRLNFSTCRYIRFWDKKLFREILSFSGWNLLGSGTNTLTNQGINFFVNRYYSVALNASQGVAGQVYNAINLFITNFQTAFKPQLMQTYASGQMEEHYKLINKTSKFSFYLMLVIVIPVSFNISPLLHLWLEEVPDYTEYFIIFYLMAYLADAIASPLQTSLYANGNIKGFQVLMAVLYIIKIVICFIVLRARLLPYIPAVATMFVESSYLICVIFLTHKHCGVNIGQFVKKILLVSLVVLGVSLIVPFFLRGFVGGTFSLLLICCIDAIWVLVVSFLIGLNKSEKIMIINFITNMIRKKQTIN